jgi:hypothetical protein
MRRTIMVDIGRLTAAATAAMVAVIGFVPPLAVARHEH